MDEDADRILEALRRDCASNPLVQALNGFAAEAKYPVYLVGGYLRDAALGRGPGTAGLDVDCAVPDAETAAREFAERTGGRLVRLDPANWRVIPDDSALADTPAGWIDFSDLRGKDIPADLHARDFTINALACRLPDPAELLDPLNGTGDLKARRLRAVSDRVFREDPIRLLRAYRLAAQLNLTVDPQTASFLKRDAALLEGQPGERLRAEVFGMLADPHGGQQFRDMRDTGVLYALFPDCRRMEGIDQGVFHHADVLTHSLETVEALEGILSELPPDPTDKDPLGRAARDYLVPPHQLPVLKLAALLHDSGKPETRAEAPSPPGEDPAPTDTAPEKKITFLGHDKAGAEKVLTVAGRLRLSRRERESLVRLVSHHMRPGFLFWESGGDPNALSGRALHRLARDAGEDLPGLALLVIADAYARRGPRANLEDPARIMAFAQGVLAELEARIAPILRGPKLVTGDDLMKSLGVPEGPLVGRLLQAVEEAHAAGEIETKQEALTLAETFAQDDGRSLRPG